MKNIVVLVSGGGTNLQALIDAQKNGKIPNGKITCVISSNPDAYALTRAKENGIGTRVIVPKEFASREMYSKALLEALFQEYADLIVLAGMMIMMPAELVRKYHNRIINVHPALIPAFCGKGFYGLKPHEAVLKSGVKVTGATVHFVDEVYDHGAIIMQKAVYVKNGDTPEVLQHRVMEEAEWQILPKTIDLIAHGRVTVKDGIAIVEE